MGPTVKEAYENYQQARKKELLETKRQDAQNIIQEYEGEYGHAKEVFFKVNGARRILKSLDENSE